MPIYRSEDPLPHWCELEHFEFVQVAPGKSHQCPRRAAKEKLVIHQGQCTLTCRGRSHTAGPGDQFNLTADDPPFELDQVTEPVKAIRMCGRWGDDVGGSGIFERLTNVEDPVEQGDPTDYEKTVEFDNHFHDCDEYWIVFRGTADIVSEGKHYTLAHGDCLLTPMGQYHDVKRIIAPLRAVYFETSMMGPKRRGHLWAHTHGPPHTDRP